MMIEMIIMALIIALMMVGDEGDEGYVQILTECAKHGIKTLKHVHLDRL